MKLSVLSIAAVVVAACSTKSGEDEGSGLSPDTRVDALNDDQRLALCDWAERISRKIDVDCGNGVTARASSDGEAECRKDLMPVTTCAVTVEELELCYRSVADQPCVFIPDECQVFAECM